MITHRKKTTCLFRQLLSIWQLKISNEDYRLLHVKGNETGFTYLGHPMSSISWSRQKCWKMNKDKCSVEILSVTLQFVGVQEFYDIHGLTNSDLGPFTNNHPKQYLWGLRKSLWRRVTSKNKQTLTQKNQPAFLWNDIPCIEPVSALYHFTLRSSTYNSSVIGETLA